MAIATQPAVLSMAWASNSAADKNDIPVTMQVADMSNDGAASWSMGFPSQTSLSQGQGGYYVARKDINGALNTLSQFALFAQSGAVYNWSASVDYATGAHVRGSDGVEYIAVANSGPDVSSAVNPTTDVNYTTWKPYLRSIADFIYPVGSIYMSVNNTSPAVLFGGTWARISGQFLLGAGSGYNAGDAGGNPNGLHTLQIEEMPAHNHNVTVNNGGAISDLTITTTGAGGHSHSLDIANGAQSNGNHAHSVTVAEKTVSSTTGGQSATHTHTVTLTETTFSNAALANGGHKHSRGTMNIVGTYDAYDLNTSHAYPTSTTKPSVTGAFGYTTNSNGWSDEGDGHAQGRYTITFDASKTGAWTGKTDEQGSHTHNVKIPKTTLTCGNASVGHTHSVSVTVPAQTVNTTTVGAHTHKVVGNTSSVDNHTHNVTINVAAHTHTATTANRGGNTAVNIMPPYLVVNIWKRTA